MTFVRALTTLGALFAVIGHAERSSACGAVASPYWTIVETIPAEDAAGMPRDLGIVIKAKPWSPPGGPSFPISSLELVPEDGGVAVPGKFEQWPTPDWSVAWHPLAPLAAGKSYVLSAAVEQSAAAPAGATGTDTVELRFTTGSALAPPLVLSGALAIAFERYDRPVMKNCVCGGGCEPTGTHTEVVRARVTLPSVQGGFDADGYSAWLHLTEGAPAVFMGPGEGYKTGGNLNLLSYTTIAPGQSAEVTADVPNFGSSRLCFALNVWDPAGHAVQADPVCLDPAELSPADSPEQADDSGEASCAMVFAPRARPLERSALVWGLGALLLCRRRQRCQTARRHA